MKLIFIYGPPASGKLTVAKELSKITKYKIFHNHLTVDLVNSIFEFGTDIYSEIVARYRLELIEAAAKENIKGLIFTFLYYKNEDDKFVKQVVNRVKKHNGEVCFVQIYCDKRELIKRVEHSSRKNYAKIKSTKLLREVIRKHDSFSSVPFAKNLKINNTKLSPKKTAKIIKSHYNL